MTIKIKHQSIMYLADNHKCWRTTKYCDMVVSRTTWYFFLFLTLIPIWVLSWATDWLYMYELVCTFMSTVCDEKMGGNTNTRYSIVKKGYMILKSKESSWIIFTVRNTHVMGFATWHTQFAILYMLYNQLCYRVQLEHSLYR